MWNGVPESSGRSGTSSSLVRLEGFREGSQLVGYGL